MKSIAIKDGKIYIYELPVEGESLLIFKDEEKFINDVCKIKGCKNVRWSDTFQGYEFTFKAPENELNDVDIFAKIEDIAKRVGHKKYVPLTLNGRIAQRIGYVFNKRAFKFFMADKSMKMFLGIAILNYLLAIFTWYRGRKQDLFTTNITLVVFLITYAVCAGFDLFRLHVKDTRLSVITK